MKRLTVICLSVLLVLTAVWANAQNVTEIPVKVVEVDVQTNSVTLEGLGFPATEYRMAFNVIIKLLSGENGTASSLQVGNAVTAVVDQKSSVVHAIYVVAK